MKTIIQGALVLGMLLSTDSLFAGKCIDHGGSYPTLKDCLQGELDIMNEKKQDINKDTDLTPSQKSFGYYMAEKEYNEGVAECKANCDK